MLKGKSETGFEFELDEEVLDDWELLELLERIDDGDVTVLSKAVVSVLGKDQYERLKDFIKQRDGKIKVSIMMQEFNSIMSAEKETKN